MKDHGNPGHMKPRLEHGRFIQQVNELQKQ